MGESDSFFGLLESLGASDAGLAYLGGTRLDEKDRVASGGLPWVVSVVVRLSDAIIDEISVAGPTWTYFHHYRTVNAHIDRVLLNAGLWLQKRGGRYISVAASQSNPESPFEGRWSHKRAAILCGLGTIGRNSLFLHHQWGPRVRLGTLFTDWPGCSELLATGEQNQCVNPEGGRPPLSPLCADCGICVEACPAGALGKRDSLVAGGFEADICSQWMKKNYHHIGRGAVCGICARVCPAGKG